MKAIKCVFVGDEAAKKTGVLDIYTNQSQGSNIYDGFEKKIQVDGVDVTLHLFDVPAQADFKQYSDADVFILCFSLVSPASLNNIEKTYAPAIKEACSNAHLLLVGTCINERNDLTDRPEENKTEGMEPIMQSSGEEMKQKINATDYIECSISNNININTIFEQAVRSITGTKPEENENHNHHGKKDCLIC